MKRRVIPFRREIRRGTKGKDVIAVKRALSRAGYMKWIGWKFTPTFGPYAVTALKRFQRKNGLPPDGVYGAATHTRLAKHRSRKGVQAFDSYSAFLLDNLELVSPEEKRRNAVAAAAMFGYHRRPWAYSQGGSRMYGVTRRLIPPKYPTVSDCSAFSTWCYMVADRTVGGVPDPNGFNYRGWGYTGTLQDHGVQISSGQLRKGDMVFYGYQEGGRIAGHVAVYVGGGFCVGHGSAGGPRLHSVHYRPVRECRSYL